MNYSNIKNADTSSGEGVRVSLFVSGCDFHCPGCVNPGTQSFEYGARFDSKAEEAIMAMVSESTISGLSILGGNPLCQDDAGLMTLYMLCNRVRYRGKTVWLWTCHTWEDIFSLPCRNSRHQFQKFLVADCNVVVDGTFQQELADRKLVWKSSSNQRVIDVAASLRAGHAVTYQN